MSKFKRMAVFLGLDENDELELAPVTPAGLNLLTTGNSYWTSSETSSTNAIALLMSDGSLNSTAKTSATVYLRPIRAFDVTSNTYASSSTAPTNAGTYLVTPSALTLAAGRLTLNYAGFRYDTTTVSIRKISQAK